MSRRMLYRNIKLPFETNPGLKIYEAKNNIKVRTLNSFINVFLLTIIILLAALGCKNDLGISPKKILPGGKVPIHLYYLQLSSELTWAERNMLSTFQGLINRVETRIYYIETEQDKFWLDYYRDNFKIQNSMLKDYSELFKKFSSEINGYILYDSINPHSLNVATSIGALENLLPITKELEGFVKSHGLDKKREINNSNLDCLEVYRKACKELLPKCNKEILAALCVHHPRWPTSTVKNRDYIVAHNIFSFDLSSSERDKADYDLLREVYSSIDEGAIIMGWHCVRDKEHEAIGLASEYGHFGMCNLHTPNLTVHSSIPLENGKVFSQRKLDTDDLLVEDKVYIAYMATDGDASWFMNDLVVNDWADPAHGQFKYNWGFLPLAYDLMPGTVKYYLENMKETDYFVAGPAGATYTYPYLHPDPKKFLKLSDEYMRKCGLTTVHMTNWNDRDWWQEVELPNFYEELQRELPNSIGFVRGMGESAFEKTMLSGEKSYIFCGEGIHRGDDVFKTMKDFIDACPNRPLFIYSLVNHSIPISEIKTAMDKFSDYDIEIVHLDELLLLTKKAFDNGKITNELYPLKDGIKKIMMVEAKNSWKKLVKNLDELNDGIQGSEQGFKNIIEESPIGVEPIVAGDFLAFTTVWNSMSLVKSSLERRGIYVNNKEKAVNDFMKEFKKIEDIKIVEELNSIWQNWHSISLTYKDAKYLTIRLYTLSNNLNEIFE